MIAEKDVLAGVESLDVSHDRLIQRHSEKCSLLVCGFNVFLIRAIYFEWNTERAGNECVAEVMVEVAVCGYKVLWGKSVLLYVFFDSKLLFLIISSAVDDDAFLGVVANHVAVLLQHVACEGLYIKHFFLFS